MSRHPSKVLKVDTGHILLINGEKESPLECLVIGDYGKEKNIKADFLGLTEEINGVPHGDLVPLSEKLVVTISTQYGCNMACSFCSPPGTMVNTPKGLVAIENLKVGDMVIGYDLDEDRIQIQEIEELLEREYTGELISIELENGSMLKVTPNHEIYTKDRGWVEAGNLEETDELILLVE